MSSQPNPTAGIVVIGNEILSGRTPDQNVAYIALHIGARGIVLKEVRIVPDEKLQIIEAVNTLRRRYDVVFTTGGIGTTHDDITAAAIAEAFGRPLVRNMEAVQRMDAVYGQADCTGIEGVRETRLKLADMPEGATLIDNSVSIAPGFCVENVYVLAGVPSIMQAMLQSTLERLPSGTPFLTRTISATLSEGRIAAPLAVLQEKYPEVAMGSYPKLVHKVWSVSVVLESTSGARLEAATQDVKEMFETLGITPTIGL